MSDNSFEMYNTVSLDRSLESYLTLEIVGFRYVDAHV